MATSDERLTKLEVSVGVLDTKMDTTCKKLDDLTTLLQNQTTILSKLLVYEEKTNTIESDLKSLKNDYKSSRDDLLKALVAFRVVVFSGAVFVSTIMGLGLYIYNNKIEMLNKHEQMLTKPL